MINIILCGGSGTRLWPISRTMLPKQFVKLFEGNSLFQMTLERNKDLCDSTTIVSNVEQFFLAAYQMTEIKDTDNTLFLLEPQGRNTAPAIALACMAAERNDIVFVTSSDHVIKKQSEYEKVVKKAADLAESDNLVVFGIEPKYAETGYGYIEAEGEDVLSFKEKPSQGTAEEYIAENSSLNAEGKKSKYLWNSGMFCFKAGVFLDELEKYAPEIFYSCLNAYKNLFRESALKARINLDDMLKIPSDSVDYAVFEKSEKVKVVPCDIGWSDLGSFDSVYDEFISDKDNIIIPSKNNSPDPVCLDSKGNLIITEDRQIALIDVENLLIADSADALLISKRGSSQKVREAVVKIKKTAPELTEIHRVAHRPWGTYEVLLNAEQYKIKRIVVMPHRKLSLQKHLRRNEHWIVVSGTATVTVGERHFQLFANESTYINMGEVHRLENAGEDELKIIEVQVGEYVGEDDIIRLEDEYGRLKI